MSSVPEGVQTVSGEGKDLSAAIAEAATALGVDTNRVKYKFDMSHFRSSAGRPVPRTTVKITAWAGDPSEEPPPREARTESSDRPERSDREDRGDRGDRGDRPRGGDRGDRGDRGGRGRGPRRDERGGGLPVEEGALEASDAPAEAAAPREPREPRPPREARPPRAPAPERDRDRDRDREAPYKPEALKGAEAGPTDASRFAETWFAELIKLMDVAGTVTGTGSSERVHLRVQAERAGRIVGKRGSTLGAIRHLLKLALVKAYGELTIDVDVADDRPRGEEAPREARPPREERRDRGDRPPRRERGGGGDRPRGGDRGGDRGSDRGDEKRYGEDTLKELARRAAGKAKETGKTITIKLDLNSYDRRIVHLEISGIDGVSSKSEEKDGQKFIQVIPNEAN